MSFGFRPPEFGRLRAFPLAHKSVENKVKTLENSPK